MLHPVAGEGVFRPAMDQPAGHGPRGVGMTKSASRTKYIFVTGGVVSSLGKGVASASIGALLEARGLKVTLVKMDPVHQRRSGHDEPVPARRGLRHRRRRRDRPRPGPLRALRLDAHQPAQQLHHRRGLPHGDREGAPRRLPRRDGAGDPAHHRRDQAPHPRSGRGRQRLHLRGRRHGRRHREPALHRGDPPARLGRRARERALRAPHAGAVHRLGGRAEDQADAAQREGADRLRHPARHPALPRRRIRSRRR